MTWDELCQDLRRRANGEIAAGADQFMRWPDRWWADPHWRCPDDHVSTRILRCEESPRDRCLACQQQVHLTFPEDHDGPLT